MEKLFNYQPPEGSCHSYYVTAKDIPSAQKKFMKWQTKELRHDEQWSEADVMDSSNWYVADDVHIVR